MDSHSDMIPNALPHIFPFKHCLLQIASLLLKNTFLPLTWPQKFQKMSGIVTSMASWFLYHLGLKIRLFWSLTLLITEVYVFVCVHNLFSYGSIKIKLPSVFGTDLNIFLMEGQRISRKDPWSTFQPCIFFSLSHFGKHHLAFTQWQ